MPYANAKQEGLQEGILPLRHDVCCIVTSRVNLWQAAYLEASPRWRLVYFDFQTQHMCSAHLQRQVGILAHTPLFAQFPFRQFNAENKMIVNIN